VKQPLAIVGASTRSAAASAVRAGFQPLAADLFADADLRHIATTTRISPYPEGFVDWLRVVEPPCWMYTGALENHPDLIDQMAWIAPLLGNPGDVLVRVRSPWELAEALGNAGLLFPEIRRSAEGLPIDGSWLVKSYQGASGSGVREFSLDRAAGHKNLGDPTACFQRRISGIPCAAVFVAMDGTAVLYGVTRQLIGEPWLGSHGFQYAGSIGLLPISEATDKTLMMLGDVLTKQFDLSGLFGIDIILDGDQVWTIEVNPRYTASMEICERATGWHAIESHVSDWLAAAPATDSAWKRLPHLAHGKAIMFARRDIVISESFAEMSLTEALRKPWPTLADVSPAGTIVGTGRPILTVFAQGQTVELVEQRLRERVVKLEQIIYKGDVP
jgi:predicted ATP-grasp superfamily ATP-dependent carboligase